MTAYTVSANTTGMPRGNPKRPTVLRISPHLIEAAREHGMPLTRMLEEGAELWIAREKRRKAAKPDPLAKHLTPPTAREIAARTKERTAHNPLLRLRMHL